MGSHLRANGLGLLVGVVAVRDLESLDLGDVGLLGVLSRDALLDLVGPGVVLGFALDSWEILVSVRETYVPSMHPSGCCAVPSFRIREGYNHCCLVTSEQEEGLLCEYMPRRLELTLMSNMPGLVAASKSSPLAILKRAARRENKEALARGVCLCV